MLGALTPAATLVAASRAARAPAVTERLPPVRNRTRESRPTRNARSPESRGSCDTGSPLSARRTASLRELLESAVRNWDAPYPSVPEALGGDTGVGPDVTAVGLPSPWDENAACGTRPMTTVEMACLKINCS